MQEITKEFDFEMAHILSNHKGLCGNLHGHSYKLFMTLSGNVNEDTGMILDFHDLKLMLGDIVKDLDHCFAYNTTSTDPFEKEIAEVVKKYNKKIYEFPFRTTAENMSTYIKDQTNDLLKSLYHGKYPQIATIKCTKVQLYETATGSSTSLEK